MHADEGMTATYDKGPEGLSALYPQPVVQGASYRDASDLPRLPQPRANTYSFRHN